MDPIIDIANGLISKEMMRSQTYSQNIANSGTVGYKRMVTFDDALNSLVNAPRDMSAGKLIRTDRTFDLTVDRGFLEIARNGKLGYLSSASFVRDTEGRLVTSSGWVLQASSGGDLIVSTPTTAIRGDGTVANIESPTAVRLVTAMEGAEILHGPDGVLHLAANAVRDAPQARISTGLLEASNVLVSDEMVRLMESVRRVESGQKLVHVYDDIIGSVLQRLGDL